MGGGAYTRSRVFSWDTMVYCEGRSVAGTRFLQVKLQGVNSAELAGLFTLAKNWEQRQLLLWLTLVCSTISSRELEREQKRVYTCTCTCSYRWKLARGSKMFSTHFMPRTLCLTKGREEGCLWNPYSDLPLRVYIYIVHSLVYNINCSVYVHCTCLPWPFCLVWCQWHLSRGRHQWLPDTSFRPADHLPKCTRSKEVLSIYTGTPETHLRRV